MLVGVGGHVASAEQGLVGRHGWWNNGVCIDAGIKDGLPQYGGVHVVANDDGDNGRLAAASVVS